MSMSFRSPIYAIAGHIINLGRVISISHVYKERDSMQQLVDSSFYINLEHQVQIEVSRAVVGSKLQQVRDDLIQAWQDYHSNNERKSA